MEQDQENRAADVEYPPKSSCQIATFVILSCFQITLNVLPVFFIEVPKDDETTAMVPQKQFIADDVLSYHHQPT